MAELKMSPCICGCDDVWAEDDGYWTVECGDCGLVGDAGETRDDAIRLWNQMIK